jgi:hypothetical protein
VIALTSAFDVMTFPSSGGRCDDFKDLHCEPAISLPNLENPGPGHELKGIFERVEGVGAACGLPMKRVDAGNVTLPWIEWGRRPGDV